MALVSLTQKPDTEPPQTDRHAAEDRRALGRLGVLRSGLAAAFKAQEKALLQEIAEIEAESMPDGLARLLRSDSRQTVDGAFDPEPTKLPLCIACRRTHTTALKAQFLSLRKMSGLSRLS